jgi:hypothetical protein
MRTRAITITTLAIAAVGLGACGDDNDATGDSAITKSDYVSQANAICRDTAGQAEDAYAEVIGNKPKTPALAQEFLARAAEIISSNVERRAAIPAPEGDEEIVAAINSAGEEAAAEFSELASSRSTAADLMRGLTPDPATEFDRLSGEYGLTECAGVD